MCKRVCSWQLVPGRHGALEIRFGPGETQEEGWRGADLLKLRVPSLGASFVRRPNLHWPLRLIANLLENADVVGTGDCVRVCFFSCQCPMPCLC